MSRPVLWTAFVLFVIGAGTFLYKVVVLDMPVELDASSRVWRVELSVVARGHAESGRVELRVPSSDDAQIILDEQSYDDGLTFNLLEDELGRRAIWRGRFAEAVEPTFAFRVHLPEADNDGLGPLRGPRADSSPPRAGQRRPAVLSAEIESTLKSLDLTEQDDPEAIIATAFGFVAHEIETVLGASDDARIALRVREGSDVGKGRLLIVLLEAAGVEARLASGVELPTSGKVAFTTFVEARTPRGWMRLLTTEEKPGDFPADFVRLGAGAAPVLVTTGVEASQVEIHVLRERLQPAEIASMVAPASPFWRAMSLYRLPIETQATLRVLLVLPLSVLLAGIFRNLIGIQTFGIFMPILIALSLRRTDLMSGLALVTSVTCAGVIGRLVLDQLRLLFVPRICLLLCLVVLLVTGLAQVGYAYEGRGFMSGLLFPIVILAMLIERISVTTLEEGLEVTQKLFLGSIALASLAYPVFQSDRLSEIFFGFPELVLCVMALLVLIGGYRGYRVSELWRFRTLAQAAAAEDGAPLKTGGGSTG